MAHYQLTDKQKELIRILAPGLQKELFETNLLYSPHIGGAEIIGMPQNLQDVGWNKVQISDLEDFEECGFFRLSQSEYGSIKISLHKQRIIEAVESNFGEAKIEDDIKMSQSPDQDRRKVFVIHGRNLAIKNSFFAFLRAINLNPLDWEEWINLTGTASPYIGEILDVAFENAWAIVALMTPDDIAQLRPKYQTKNDALHEKELTPQSRPNVLFEAGMAFGKNKNRTILVEVGDLRPFSDIAGRMAVHFDGSVNSRQILIDRFKTAKCDVQVNGTAWINTGEFDVSDLSLQQNEIRTNIWGKSGHIWWLHGDLISLLGALVRNEKPTIDDYLRRTIHHAIHLDLAEIYGPLESIRRVTQDMGELDWTKSQRERYCKEVERILNNASDIIKSKQPDFIPDPY